MEMSSLVAFEGDAATVYLVTGRVLYWQREAKDVYRLERCDESQALPVGR